MSDYFKSGGEASDFRRLKKKGHWTLPGLDLSLRITKIWWTSERRSMNRFNKPFYLPFCREQYVLQSLFGYSGISLT